LVAARHTQPIQIGTLAVNLGPNPLIAFLLEWVAGYAHCWSLRVSTAGFTYHPDRDVWSCPADQHLFAVFFESARGTVTYRATASACNAWANKATCTDSHYGRQIERTLNDVEHGMPKGSIAQFR